MGARFLSRRTLFTIAAVVALVGLAVTAYSRGTDTDDEPGLRAVGPGEEAEYGEMAGDDISLANVVASSEYAWVSGFPVTSSARGQILWRLDAEGSATVVGEIPDWSWLLGPGPDGGVTMGRFRCTSGNGLDSDSAEAFCDGPMVGEVVVTDSEGEELSVVELWEDADGDVGSATSIELVGASSESVWVISDGSLWEVGYGGELRRTLPREGLVCIVDGDPFALSTARESERALGEVDDSESAPSVGADEEVRQDPEGLIDSDDIDTGNGDRVTFDVSRATQSEFVPSEQSTTRTVETSADTATGRCADDGIAVIDLGDDRPVAVWEPSAGWADIPASRSPAAASGDILVDAPSGLFAVAQDGTISDLRNGGAFEETGLDISPMAGDEIAGGSTGTGEPVPGSMPFDILVDGSDSLTVACVASVGSTSGNDDHGLPCIVEGR